MVAEQTTLQEAVTRIIALEATNADLAGKMRQYEEQQAGTQTTTTDDLNATKKEANDLFWNADAPLIKTNRRIDEIIENGGNRGGGDGGYKRSLIQTKDFKIEKLDKIDGW